MDNFNKASVSWWFHKMETFSLLLALRAGKALATSVFPSQLPVTRSFGVFVDLCLTNGWVNNRDACDLKRLRPHYDVTVMFLFYYFLYYNFTLGFFICFHMFAHFGKQVVCNKYDWYPLQLGLVTFCVFTLHDSASMQWCRRNNIMNNIIYPL